MLLYVVFDGFDLGVGILFPLARTPADRDAMMNTIAPVWDGNETWLVLGGGGLLAAFPAAYAIVMPALYLPVYLMLGALILRGVAFEFRGRGRAHGRRGWTIAFAAGSTIAAFAQGLVLGGFVQGVSVRDGAFAGGPFDWLSPYSVLVACGVVAGYALLGAGWVIWKTETDLHGDARRWAWICAPLVGLIPAGRQHRHHLRPSGHRRPLGHRRRGVRRRPGSGQTGDRSQLWAPRAWRSPSSA